MNRPLYETQADRDNEAAMAGILQRRFDCQLTKMPIKYSLDYMATRNGSAVAFIEVRQRKNQMAKYPTYMLSMYKMIRAVELTDMTGLPCFLAIQWSDAAGICKLPPDNMDIRMGGSTRRNDPQDIEPVVHFGIDQFKAIA